MKMDTDSKISNHFWEDATIGHNDLQSTPKTFEQPSSTVEHLRAPSSTTFEHLRAPPKTFEQPSSTVEHSRALPNQPAMGLPMALAANFIKMNMQTTIFVRFMWNLML